MNLSEIREIRNRIHWGMTPMSYASGINDVTIASKEDIDAVHERLKERAGYYFYIDVWNCAASLHIMKNNADGSATSEAAEGIDIPEDMISAALEDQGGMINLSGHYAISDEIEKFLRGRLDESG